MVCFSASVNVRLGAAADSAVGSMGSSKSDIHPVSKLEARIIAKFRLLISYLDPVMPGMERAGERGLLGSGNSMASQYAPEVGSLPDITLHRFEADLAYS